MRSSASRPDGSGWQAGMPTLIGLCIVSARISGRLAPVQ